MRTAFVYSVALAALILEAALFGLLTFMAISSALAAYGQFGIAAAAGVSVAWAMGIRAVYRLYGKLLDHVEAL